MPGKYTRKRGGNTKSRNRAAARNLRSIRRRKSAGAQQRQLASVQHQISGVKTVLRQRSQYAQYAVPLNDDTFDMELPNGAFHVSDMMCPREFASHPLFQAPQISGTPVPGIASNKVTVRNWDVQLVFSPKNSLTALTPRIVRVYWLTLKPETAARTLVDTQNMTGPGLLAAQPGHYTHITTTDGGLATMVKFNPAAFRIRYYKEFTLANIMQETDQSLEDENVAITNTKDALRRVRFRIRSGNVIKAPLGTWQEMDTDEIMPKDRHYLVVHVGGWGGPTVDGDNAIHMDTNIVVSTRVTN